MNELHDAIPRLDSIAIEQGGGEENIAESNITVIRTPVEAGRPYQSYLFDLRYDFWYSCAYCNISELEAQGISFQIDHYKPQCKKDPNVNDYCNLYYSCQPCNLSKGDIWESDADRANGLRFIQADKDILDDHFKLIGDTLTPLTATGEYNVVLLRLNSQKMRWLRGQRRLLHDADDSILKGLQSLSKIKIDSLPTAVRSKFASIRSELDDLGRKALDVGLSTEEIIRSLNKSPLLHNSVEELQAQRDEKKLRRAYLMKIRAITL